MDRATWDRRAPLAGACFAVLAAICFFLLPISSAPKASDSGATYLNYIAMHHHALLWRGYLTGIAFLFFIWFIACLQQRLQDAGEHRLASTMYGGGLATAALGMLQGATLCWLAWDHGGGLDGNVVKALIHAPTFAFFFPWAVYVGAMSIACRRARLMPEYMTIAGCVLAIRILVAALPIAHSGFFMPGGWFAGIALIAFLVHTCLGSLQLYMPAGERRMLHHTPVMHH